MKTLLRTFTFLLVLLAFTDNAKSQNFDEPVPFFVNDYDKQNAVMGYAAQELGYLLIWEQQTDPESTAIVYWRYLSNDPPVTLIADEGVRYQNPQLYHSWWYFPQDTIGVVFYEKAVGEKTDLYYIKIASDGGQSLPVPFATEGNVNNLFTYAYYDNSIMAYHSNGHVLTFHPINSGGDVSFSVPDTVFTGEITDIVVQKDQVYWLWPNNDSTSLMMSSMTYGYNWSDPQILKTEKEISTLGGTTFEMNDGWVSFTYKAAEKWYINNVRRSWGMDDEYQLEIESDTIFDYDAFSTWIAVKGYDPELYYCAFIHDTAGAREIFMNNIYFGGNEYFQLSNLGTECRNPKFFLGESGGDNFSWGYLIWEAYTDGHWQIYRSRAPFGWSSIHEQQQPEGVSVSPNPARDFLRIQNSQELELDIKIMDITGKLILEMTEKDAEITIPTSRWPRGVYLLNVVSGSKMLTQKTILE
ncbi:MAG TPA: T9SS type A sorting domain-containing protein [Bacteroidales bacterium]|nr:T9SS type A sorting domain-containing protein [Bacteroidales bacterium]